MVEPDIVDIAEPVDDRQEFFREKGPHRGNDGRGDFLVVSRRNTSRDARQRVAVPPERYGLSYRVFIIPRVEEGDDRFGDGPLARYVKPTVRFRS